MLHFVLILVLWIYVVNWRDSKDSHIKLFELNFNLIWNRNINVTLFQFKYKVKNWFWYVSRAVTYNLNGTQIWNNMVLNEPFIIIHKNIGIVLIIIFQYMLNYFYVMNNNMKYKLSGGWCCDEYSSIVR